MMRLLYLYDLINDFRTGINEFLTRKFYFYNPHKAEKVNSRAGFPPKDYIIFCFFACSTRINATFSPRTTAQMMTPVVLPI